jgi:hypothetical protein
MQFCCCVVCSVMNVSCFCWIVCVCCNGRSPNRDVLCTFVVTAVLLLCCVFCYECKLLLLDCVCFVVTADLLIVMCRVSLLRMHIFLVVFIVAAVLTVVLCFCCDRRSFCCVVCYDCRSFCCVVFDVAADFSVVFSPNFGDKRRSLGRYSSIAD